MRATAMQVDGIDVHIEGEGHESIVMIHGWPDTYRLWDAQVEAFKAHYRCVRFTLPGFDAAQPRRAWSIDELVELFKHIVETACPGQQVTLLLHDWGCVFGYQFAMRHPALVARIVGVDVGDTTSRSFQRSLSAKAKAMIVAYQGWLALAWALGPRLGDGMTRAMVRALKVPTDPRGVGSRMNYPYFIQWTGAHGSYRGLPALKPYCPMLFIYGERKPFMFHSPAWADAIAKQPGCRVVPMQTNHWVMRDQPQAFNDAVLAWLREGDTAHERIA